MHCPLPVSPQPPTRRAQHTNQYVIKVTATDGATPKYNHTATMTIDINDRNDVPVLSDLSMTIHELSVIGTVTDHAVAVADEDTPAYPQDLV